MLREATAASGSSWPATSSAVSTTTSHDKANVGLEPPIALTCFLKKSAFFQRKSGLAEQKLGKK